MLCFFLNIEKLTWNWRQRQFVCIELVVEEVAIQKLPKRKKAVGMNVSATKHEACRTASKSGRSEKMKIKIIYHKMISNRSIRQQLESRNHKLRRDNDSAECGAREWRASTQAQGISSRTGRNSLGDKLIETKVFNWFVAMDRKKSGEDGKNFFFWFNEV